MKKNFKTPQERQDMVMALTYAQMYLQERIVQSTFEGNDTSEYERELATVNQMIKTL